MNDTSLFSFKNARAIFDKLRLIIAAAFISNISAGVSVRRGVLVTFNAIERAINYTITASPAIVDIILSAADGASGTVTHEITGLSLATVYNFTINAFASDHRGSVVSARSGTITVQTSGKCC